MDGRQTGSFGEQLRHFRARAGLSQAALAERADLSPTAVTRLERGVRSLPHPRTVAALAAALGLSATERADLMAAARPSARLRPAPPDVAEQPAVPAPRLPVWLTSFVGREAESEAVRARLDPSTSSARLLTLVGPGGVGKTRLAVAAAGALAAAYPDGVVFVDLAPLRDPRLAAAAIARALDLQEGGRRSALDLLLDYLPERRLLLVLDNFEHLPAAAPLVAELLRGCPRLAVLATSRTALRVQGEQRVVVVPLGTPAEPAGGSTPDGAATKAIVASPAVQLYVARAQAVAPGFVLTDGNAAAVAGICRRLEGIPLAIELAAARMTLLSPEALLRRLERRLGSRAIDAPASDPGRAGPLSLLTDGAPDLPERQQTLRATLDWSHDLLVPAARVLLRRLAAFAGGFTLEAAEAVCADTELAAEDVLDRLQGLADASLVQRATGAEGQPRFGMLETVREFALEQLEAAGELVIVERRHRAWCLGLVRPVAPGPVDPRQLGRLAPEHANLQAALRTASVDGAVEDGLWLAAALWMPWYLRGAYSEGRAWLGQLLAMSGAEAAPLARAHALNAAGHLAYCQGEYATAERLLGDARALADGLGDDRLGGAIRHNLAHVARWRGDLPGARALYASALALFRRLADRPWEATVLVTLAAVLHEQGDLEQAGACAAASLAFFRDDHNAWGMARALYALGLVAAGRGDHPRAHELLEASVALHRQVGDHQGRARSLLALATELLQDDEADAARPLFAESLALAETTGDRVTLARGLEGLAGVLAGAWPDRAVRLAGAADALRASLGAAPQPAEQHRLHAWLAAARSVLGAQGYAAAWAAGQVLGVPRAMAEALAAPEALTSPAL